MITCLRVKRKFASTTLKMCNNSRKISIEQNDTKNNNHHQPEMDNRKFSTKMSGGGLFSKASNTKSEKETADLAALVKNRLTNLGMKASDYGKDWGIYGLYMFSVMEWTYSSQCVLVVDYMVLCLCVNFFYINLSARLMKFI